MGRLDNFGPKTQKGGSGKNKKKPLGKRYTKLKFERSSELLLCKKFLLMIKHVLISLYNFRWNANNTQQTLPSIPMIPVLDDTNDYMPSSSSSSTSRVPNMSSMQHQQQQQQQHLQQVISYNGRYKFRLEGMVPIKKHTQKCLTLLFL